MVKQQKDLSPRSGGNGGMEGVGGMVGGGGAPVADVGAA